MSANETSLLLKIRGDAAQLKSELGGASTAVSKFAGDTSKSVSQALKEIQKVTQYKATSGGQSATDFLIAESQKAIANAEKLSASATDSVDRVSSRLAVAQQEASSLGAGVSSLAADLTLIVGPAAAVTAGFVAVSTAIYEVSSAAAQAEAEIYNLSKRTGVAAETLSALSNAVEPLGGSMSSISSALIIFQKNMEKAKDEGSEMSNLFQRLGIDTDDTDKAFRQAFNSLASLSSEQERTAVGAKLFGRSVKDLEAILRENGGDIDSLIEKYSDYGTLIGTQAASAGHQFVQSQVELQQQLKATEREFGEQFYPVVIKVMTELTTLLRENGETFKAWGSAGATAVNSIKYIGPILDAVTLGLGATGAALVTAKYAWEAYAASVRLATAALQEEASAASTSPVAVPSNTATAPPPPNVSTTTTTSKQVADAERIAQQEREDAIRKADQAYKDGTISIQERTKERIDAAKLERDVIVNTVNDRIKAINEERQKATADKEKLNQEVEDLLRKREKAERDFDRAQTDAQNEQRDKQRAAAAAYRASELAAQEKYDQARLTQIRSQAQETLQQRRQVEAQVEEVENAAIKRRYDYYRQEQLDAGQNLEAQTRIKGQLAQLDADRTDLAAKQAARRAAIEQAETNKLKQIQEEVRAHFREMLRAIEDMATGGATPFTEFERYVEDINRKLRDTGKALDDATVAYGRMLALILTASKPWYDNAAAVDAMKASLDALYKTIQGNGHDVTQSIASLAGGDAPISKQLDIFDEFGSKMAEVFGGGQEMARAFGDVLSGVFSNIANAVGQAVQSFVLFGKVKGGFRAFVAELISSLASAAAVQAVYELAQGLAWLALNYFFPNPKYAAAAATAFASAAVFGSVAGVAALAGRAVAGNAFAQQGTGGGAGSSASGGYTGSSNGSGGIYSERDSRTIEQGRNVLTQTIILRVESNDSHIVNVLQDNVSKNGLVRDLIVETVSGVA